MTNNGLHPVLQAATLSPQLPKPGIPWARPLTALSIEFVARPQEAHRAETAIPAAIAGALGQVTGFAGCLVMIADQEARLVTVVTLWSGEDRVKRCSQNVRGVCALLAPYLDRCLRVQTMVAHLPTLPVIRAEATTARECSRMENLLSKDETVCVA